MNKPFSQSTTQEMLEKKFFFRPNSFLADLKETESSRLAEQVLHEAIKKGTQEFCVCPGSRNAPFIYALANSPHLTLHYWPEERSAAFFALGRIKATGRPVAIVVTSGTAAGELLPAAMEAHYAGLPLLLVTADRPARFRGKGAPQSAEQVGLFGQYAHFSQDLSVLGPSCDLTSWDFQGPAHLNVCFEEPKDDALKESRLTEKAGPFIAPRRPLSQEDEERFDVFLSQVDYPLVVVGGMSPAHRESAIRFLLKLNAPIYAEALSGLREDSRLAPLRISTIDRLWRLAEENGYPIDGVLRIGQVPVARLWRDLEEKEGLINVCSISELPFSGLSWASTIYCSLTDFFERTSRIDSRDSRLFQNWQAKDKEINERLLSLFLEEPLAEPSLIHQLSRRIGKGASVYLGNSLPIREWDLAATVENRAYQMAASRGLNGIDGQIAACLGFSLPERENWGIIGDLTALYDMAGPWILSQLKDTRVNLAIINNSGGQIFKRLFSHAAFQQTHQLNFSGLANFWGMRHERWLSIPDRIENSQDNRLIEIIPDSEATDRFWKMMSGL